VLTPLETSRRGGVLIVDHSEDSREVLRTALERRGVQTFEAAGARQGVELAHQYHPRVIVLDVDSEAADDDGVRNEYGAESRDHDAYLVVIGRSVRYEQAVPPDCVVPKPYHYAPLVRTIERLLGASAGG
jgi:DNA-binding NtrC family response regulator